MRFGDLTATLVFMRKLLGKKVGFHWHRGGSSVTRVGEATWRAHRRKVTKDQGETHETQACEE